MSREYEVGEVVDDGEEVYEVGSISLVEFGEFVEIVKELYYFGVIVGFVVLVKDYGGG